MLCPDVLPINDVSIYYIQTHFDIAKVYLKYMDGIYNLSMF